ncbi:MAG: response regulator [Lachnospiraceae bacterium]|nr:response regulator [Lachnospiraceae bacterium]
MGKQTSELGIKSIVTNMIHWTILILLTILSWYLFRSQSQYSIHLFGDFVMALSYIPFLLIAGLYGYLLSMLSFLTVFLYVMITSMEGAFYLSVFLACVLVYSLFAQYYWFQSKLKTLLGVFITALVSGAMGGLCFGALPTSTYELSALGSISYYFIGAITPTALVSLVLYCFFNYAPDRIKSVFPIGYGYTKGYQEDTLLRNYHRKTKLSVKITTIIVVVELLLGISVAWFTVALFPDLKDMMIENHQITAHPDKRENMAEQPEKSSDFAENITDLEYKINRYAISFDIKMLLLVMCVGVPLASIANYYTKVRIGAPIGAMSVFLDDFMHTDDQNKMDKIRAMEKYHFDTHDEIAVLSESLNEALKEIADFIERKEEQQKLESELEVARQASDAKSSFLSNMSHEIRTPINAILGMNEMILRECDDEQIIEYANSAKSAGNTLLSLVNDILDFSKIEAGKMEIITAQYHLGSTVNDLVNMVASKAQEKGLALEVDVDEHIPCMLIGDELRIKQCLTNLLSNAVKYTDEGVVTLNIGYDRIDENEIYLNFEVKDTGNGIKEEDLSKLFSPFERIEEIKNRSIEGTGLGMSIVKKLLALMDTRLEVHSVYGQGSDFSFRIKQQVVSNEKIGDFKKKYKEYLRTQEKYHQRFQAPSARILVVDDNEMNLTVMKGLLKQTRIQIDTAESGFETLEKVKEHRYDAIFLDHRMPKMDGVQTLEAMKSMTDNLNDDVPVISLTANAISGAKAEYLAYGFTDYLAKPVNGAELEKMLEKYLPMEKLNYRAFEDTSEAKLDAIPEDSVLRQLQEIDLEEALKNCGGADVLEKVIKDFYISIDAKSEAIENALAEEDIRNYTVYVHALKSSARLIGAMKLSRLAEELEEKGNEENLIVIRQKTPELLVRYRGYLKHLAMIVSKKENLPLIDSAQVDEALRSIRELVEAYDFQTAESILKMLESYQIPKDSWEKYDRMVHLMAALDREEILKTRY